MSHRDALNPAPGDGAADRENVDRAVNLQTLEDMIYPLKRRISDRKRTGLL